MCKYSFPSPTPSSPSYGPLSRTTSIANSAQLSMRDATCNLDDCRTRRLRSNTNWGGWAAQTSTHDIDRATSIVVTSSKVEPLEYVEAPLAGVQLALRIYFRIHAS